MIHAMLSFLTDTRTQQILFKHLFQNSKENTKKQDDILLIDIY